MEQPIKGFLKIIYYNIKAKFITLKVLMLNVCLLMVKKMVMEQSNIQMDYFMKEISKMIYMKVMDC